MLPSLLLTTRTSHLQTNGPTNDLHHQNGKVTLVYFLLGVRRYVASSETSKSEPLSEISIVLFMVDPLGTIKL